MRRSLLLSLCLVLALASGEALALEAPGTSVPSVEPPEVSARSWLLYDDTFDRELGALDARERRAMASTTKMMTALVVVDRVSPSELVTVSERAAGVGEASMRLVAGEQVTVRDLLAAILVASANDAAMALAEHVGGSMEGFVELMNHRAIEMGLEDTHFTNPHGLDDQSHFSSASDLLVMARALMERPMLAELVATRTHPFPPDPNGRARVARATNQLLRTYPGAVGVKTGYTGQAGLTLVAAADRDDRRLYAVVLGSEDHFADAALLLEYGFRAFGPTEVLRTGAPYALRRGPAGTDHLRAFEGAEVFMSVDEAERLSLVLRLEADVPVLTALLDDREVARTVLEEPPASELPDLREAAAWASRYWDRVWGSRQ